MVRSKTQPHTVVRGSNSSMWKAEEGGSFKVREQQDLQSEFDCKNPISPLPLPPPPNKLFVPKKASKDVFNTKPGYSQ